MDSSHLLSVHLDMYKIFPVCLWGSFQFDSYITWLLKNKISIDGTQEVTIPLSQHSEAVDFRAVETADLNSAGDFV